MDPSYLTELFERTQLTVCLKNKKGEHQTMKSSQLVFRRLGRTASVESRDE